MITLFSLSDSVYFKYLKSLVKSSRKYYPELKFYIFLVNPTKKQILQMDGIPNTVTIVEEKKFKNEREKRCYCASRRGYLFTKLREWLPNNHLVWIDSDSVFIKRDKSFHKHILSCDVSMRAKNLKQGKFASGVISGGPKSSDFFKEYYNKINSRMDLLEWTSDQKMLNATYHDFKNKINFKPLPKIFCDVWYTDKGVLWVAKGKCRNDNRYQTEMKKWV